MHQNRKSCIQGRTFNYYSNGTGRDSYVMDHNAGFSRCAFKNDLPDKHYRNISMNTSLHSQRKYNTYEPRTNHYFSDGSGRDNYIVREEGGNIQRCLQNNHANSHAFVLRNYEKKQSIDRDDFYQRSQRLYKTNAVTQDILRQKQFSLTQSLSVPKRHDLHAAEPTKSKTNRRYDSIQQGGKNIIK